MANKDPDPIAAYLHQADRGVTPPNPLDMELPDNAPDLDVGRDTVDAAEPLDDQSSVIDDFDTPYPDEVEAPHAADYAYETAPENVSPEDVAASASTPGRKSLAGAVIAGLSALRKKAAKPAAAAAENAAAPSPPEKVPLRAKARKFAMVVVIVLLGGAALVSKMSGKQSPSEVDVALLDSMGSGLEDVTPSADESAEEPDQQPVVTGDAPDTRLLQVDVAPALDLSVPQNLDDAMAPFESTPSDAGSAISVTLPSIDSVTPEPTPAPVEAAPVVAAAAAEPTPAPTPAPPPTPSSSSPRAKASTSKKGSAGGAPQLRVLGIAAAPSCWSCGASAILASKGVNSVVNDGDTWNGYRVAISGDRVTLSSKAGQWSFLPEH
ncbi:hypothetical protein E4T66_18340 [Sinimarinibacterium sp. CAU 1509]|uniref:hypothetical protein n=1 Tax=Sinimarinibacterium sp. CAU 1509 TaxID=2562283 RepID=UPI0010AC266C|nr:hypothetical protein [Sinimarinibacterium sp. CAU 1509]TJY57366.1 hypothetical protein E4T66_18340 [Sinimarinibacterium sp. CAU 1509]